VDNQVDLGGDLERFRIERDPILNGDVDTLEVLNLRHKSCVSVCFTCFTFQLLLLFLVFVVLLP
jgi:hypothetical protein